MPPKGRGPSKGAASKRSAESAGDVPTLEPEIVDDLEEVSPALEPLAEAAAAGDDSAANLPVPLPEYSGALVPRDALSSYLAEIRRYPVLSREEEHELAVHYYETGDPEAAYRLITGNLRLVVMVAREYQRAFHNLLDLIQEGNVGLLEAVKKFDPYRGVRLPSYAVWWIRAYVIRHVMNNFRLVKVGTTQAQRRLFFNLKKERARLEAQGFKPTAKLIAENLGVKEAEVIEMDQRMGSGAEVSTEAPLSAGSDTQMMDLLPYDDVPPDEQVAEREFYGIMHAKLEEFSSTLEGREKDLFVERLVADDPITLQELGERFGVSRERVRQIEEALKKRLREFLVAQVKLEPEDVHD